MSSALFATATIAPAGQLATAAADDCPSVDVLFARGTGDEPGLGSTGTSFAEAMLERNPELDLRVTPVDYPATTDWKLAVEGVDNARNYVEATAAACPDTSFVLGGFSQGAVVMNMLTGGPNVEPVIPHTVSIGDSRCGTTGAGHCDGIASSPERMAERDARATWGVAEALPAAYASRIAALVAFGDPFNKIDAPLTGNVGYELKSINLCNHGDPICGPGESIDPHLLYGQAGLTAMAATIVTGLLHHRVPAPPLPPPPAPYELASWWAVAAPPPAVEPLAGWWAPAAVPPPAEPVVPQPEQALPVVAEAVPTDPPAVVMEAPPIPADPAPPAAPLPAEGPPPDVATLQTASANGAPTPIA